MHCFTLPRASRRWVQSGHIGPFPWSVIVVTYCPISGADAIPIKVSITMYLLMCIYLRSNFYITFIKSCLFKANPRVRMISRSLGVSITLASQRSLLNRALRSGLCPHITQENFNSSTCALGQIYSCARNSIRGTCRHYTQGLAQGASNHRIWPGSPT